MKQYLWIVSAWALLGLSVHATDITLLTDDFEDASLDTSKWTVVTATGSGISAATGSTLVESNGWMNISHAVSDAGGAYRTTLLPVNDRGVITITRRTQVHYANEYVSMSEELVSESGSTKLSWGYFNYNYSGTTRYGFGGAYDTRVTGVWNAWFDESITYDPLTGQGTYAINGGDPVTLTGSALPAGTTNVYLQGGAYGWYTGHLKQFDSFTVSQEEMTNQVILIVSSSQGAPVPATGRALYETGTTVTCSVENVTSGGIRYQCTGWTGTGSVPSSGTTNAVVVTLGEDSTLTWTWEALDAVLTVSSAQGSPVPAVGNTLYSIGSVVTCSVADVISADTRHLCTGWTGTGTAPSSGSTTQVVFTLSGNASVTWNWQTDYRLEITVEGEGSVSPTNGFYAKNSVQNLVALPSSGWKFEKWTGDSSGSGNVAVTMTGPKNITAVFSWPSSVTNVTAAQVEGSRTVQVSYDMNGTRQMLIDLEIQQGGSNLNASALSGALGIMSAGTNKVISWNAGTDWNGNVGELTFNLVSEDGLPFYAPYDLNAPSLVPQTGQTNAYGYAETDGDLRPGLEWPEPRFIDNGDNTITDKLTGLMWAKSYSTATWSSSLLNCDNAILAGYSDWRLPNVREMCSLFSNFERYSPALQTGVFSLNPSYYFWTSTVFEYSPIYAHAVHAGSGAVIPITVSQTYAYLPVRGSSTGAVHVAKTGQIYNHYSYNTEDGDVKLGEAWPNPRFTNNGDGTFTDELTGLMWHPYTLGQATWYNALTACRNLTSYGYDDWRLPSVLELESLIDFGKKYPAPMLPTGHPFQGVVASSDYSYHYWTGTSYAGGSSSAFKISFYDGQTYYNSKGNIGTILACRGGRVIQETIPEPVGQYPLPQTGQTNSYASRDDGSVRAGIAAPSPRFTQTEVCTFRDNLTGLLWYIGMGSQPSSGYWQYAVSDADYYINIVDWRLPNIREMQSLVDASQDTPVLPAGHPFQLVRSNAYYWTSTSYYTNGTTYAWQIDMATGQSSPAQKWAVNSNCYAMVFGPVAAPLAYVYKTGQTNSYYADDDGANQRGYVQSGNRFTDNGNSTITDNRTGLMWLKSVDSCGLMTWAEGVAFCANLNFGGYTDWRLPNARELESLVDYSQGGYGGALPADHPFVNMDLRQGNFFWSSTTANSDTNRAAGLYLINGMVTSSAKGFMNKVWPVRGGN